MKHSTRRDFLASAARIGIASSAFGSFSRLFGFKETAARSRPIAALYEDADEKSHRLILLTPAGDLIEEIPLTADPHSVMTNALKPGEIVVSSMDREIEILRRSPSGKWASSKIELKGPGTFCGHSLLTRDGKHLITLAVMESQAGFVTIYDLNSRKEIRRFSSGGNHPHELRYADGESTVAIAHAGLNEVSELTILDLKTAQAKERYTYPHGNQRFLHFTIGDSGVFALGGLNDEPPSGHGFKSLFNKASLPEGKILLGKRADSKIHALQLPDTVINDPDRSQSRGYKSLELSDKNGFGVATDTINGEAIVFSLSDRQFQNRLKLPFVKGAAIFSDGSGFLLSTQNGQVVSVSGSLQNPTLVSKTHPRINGHHLHTLAWQLPKSAPKRLG